MNLVRAVRPLGSFRRSAQTCRVPLFRSPLKLGPLPRFYGRPAQAMDAIQSCSSQINVINSQAGLLSFQEEIQKLVQKRSLTLELREKYKIPEGLEISADKLENHSGVVFHFKTHGTSVVSGHLVYEDLEGSAFDQKTLVFTFLEPGDYPATTVTWMESFDDPDLVFPRKVMGCLDEHGLMQLVQVLEKEGYKVAVDDIMGYLMEKFLTAPQVVDALDFVQSLRRQQEATQHLHYQRFRWNPLVPEELELHPEDSIAE